MGLTYTLSNPYCQTHVLILLQGLCHSIIFNIYSELVIFYRSAPIRM